MLTSPLSLLQLDYQPVGGREHDGIREGIQNKPLSVNSFLGPTGTRVGSKWLYPEKKSESLNGGEGRILPGDRSVTHQRPPAKYWLQRDAFVKSRIEQQFLCPFSNYGILHHQLILFWAFRFSLSQSFFKGSSFMLTYSWLCPNFQKVTADPEFFMTLPRLAPGSII